METVGEELEVEANGTDVVDCDTPAVGSDCRTTIFRKVSISERIS